MENTTIPTGGENPWNDTQDYNWTGEYYYIYEEYEYVTTSDMSTVNTIWKVIPPFLVVFGSIGNVLIIAVLIHSAMHKATTGMLFCALAASDLVGLYVGLLPQWIADVTDVNHHEKGDFLCKVLPWLLYSVLDYSAWILVAVTCERVVATCFPLISKTKCTRRFAVGYLVSSGFVILCINAHMLYGFEYAEEVIPGNETSFYCIDKPQSYINFFERVWPWIDVTVYCLLPFTVICVGNCVIVVRVKSSYKRSVRRDKIMSPNNKTISLTRGKREKRISNLTLTLLLVNSAFFVSTFPVSVFIIAHTLSDEYFGDDQNVDQITIWWAFVNYFMYLNNTCNVFLYCLSGSKFRNGALELLRRIWTLHLKIPSKSVGARQTGSYRSTDEDSRDTDSSMNTQDTSEGQANLAFNEVEI